MRNPQQVLREKEMDLARVRQQVEALRYVAPMLAEQRESLPKHSDDTAPESNFRNRWPLDV